MTLRSNGNCRSCGKPIRWVLTNFDKRMPLDPDPVEGGNVRVLADGTAVVERKGFTSTDPLYVSHFATCPDAKDWKGKTR